MVDIGPFIRTDYKEVDKHDEMSNVLGWVTGDSDKVPVVTDQGRPFGVVNERALVGRRIDPHTKIEAFALTTRAVTPQASVGEAMARMAEFRAAHLPVQDERGRVAGYVSAMDLLREQLPDARARDLCVPVTRLQSSQRLSEAHHAFRQEYVGHLPVMDDQGRVAGVIPRRKVILMEARQKTSKGRKDAGGNRIHPQHEELANYLEGPPVLIDAGAPLGEVLKKVEEFGYVLVRDANGGLQGIVTPETLTQLARQG